MGCGWGYSAKSLSSWEHKGDCPTLAEMRLLSLWRT